MNDLIDNQVKPLYMQPVSPLQCTAIVTKTGCSEINKKKYQWIQLNETIFHPKGGGQLSDEGTINGIKVAYVHKNSLDKNRLDRFEILHCFEEGIILPFKEGDEVHLVVDGDIRALYSRMHTAGHVLAGVVNDLFPQLEASHGNHPPQDGYVKFKMLNALSAEKEEIKDKAQRGIDIALKQNLPVSVITLSSGMRAIEIGKQVMTCGGTHVHSIQEIGAVEIVDVTLNKKEHTVTVKYRLA